MTPAPEIVCAPPEVKGWCPGAYAPMASNDGLLIRAKIIGSRLSAAQARAIADIAAECGNGAIDLSQRAQLQIRGVREDTLGEALRRLDAAGLLPPSAEAERITNIVASPLAGLTFGAFDANALADDLAQALQADEDLRALPAKFLFVIDDAGALPLDKVAADIRIEATDTNTLAIRLGGAPTRAVITTPDNAVATALKLARAFIALRGRAFELRRMSSLVDALGVDALMREAGLDAADFARAPQSHLAIHGARTHGRVSFCGVAMPFGRWRARDMAAVAEIAENEGVGELRVTPWRTMLIPTKGPQAASRITILAHVHGFITSAEDLRLAVVACAGAPECPQSLGPTRNAIGRVAALAHELAGADGVGLHISGCAKGCARPGATPVTVIVTPDGFDIVDNGRASDASTIQLATMEAVVQHLARRASEHKS